ncbi:DUF87 domain-containing protein [Catellatospora sp. NPDC049111]|uniref:ATP-binding protein n=1 Tax=Catellatospora sp. NPDC049111 TaxID=3155271 RepID=UPI0033EC873C
MISPQERFALEALGLNPAPTPDDVWRPSPYDVPELHERVVSEILSGVGRARRDENTAPLMVAMQGLAGSGKTHLLGAVRERIQRDGGYFFLVSLISGKTFWESTALCIVEALGRDALGWGSQLKTFHRRFTSQLGLPTEVRDAVAGDAPLTRAHLDAYIVGLRTHANEVGRECQDTARALVLHGSRNFEAQDIGDAYLMSEPGDPDGRRDWGISPAVRPPQLIVRDISRLIALTLGPSVIAVDQIDTLFAQAKTIISRHDGQDREIASVIAPIADGLLNLREITRRTLTVISCLPDTWELLTAYAASPVMDRIRVAVLPDRIPSAAIGQAIVAKRFAAGFAEHRFSAPYDTWPIAVKAFDDSVDCTPRQLLLAADRHVRRCLDRGAVDELYSFREDVPVPPHRKGATESSEFTALDVQFRELVATADISGALDPKTEDTHMPALLAAGLAAWIDEQAPTGATFKHDPLPGAKPALHGRLIEVLNATTENEAHWGFRAIGSDSAVAVISRVKAACTKIGLDVEMPLRKLVLLRAEDWPSGKRTAEVLQAFRDAGGVELRLASSELKVLDALRRMRQTADGRFAEWLVSRRPASSRTFLGELLRDKLVPAAADDTSSPRTATSGGDGRALVPLGHRAEDQAPFAVDLESLRRHCVIFAGSGSGKTVLIRRLVEECALLGVSSIVLDPNNDLARLGDPWPDRPAGWLPDDPARAQDYHDHTEVVVWTPRVMGGRPLAFQPLPDFSSVQDSPDEFDQAVRSAVAALVPRAGLSGVTKLAQQGRAVLTEALQQYARGRTVGLRGFVDFLSELPEGVSRMAKAEKLAQDAAETLKAAMVTDPLFGGDGTSADPGVLLTPSAGKRARVSVISFIGLSSDEERQSFVNQLQMALFAWIKRHPAGDRPLGGLLIMDEAQTLAPSTGNTPCTASSIALAAQARKYGLGLVFATQAPKGLHNQISGNATTQFFGLLNAPAQIDAAKELALAKGGRLPDIGVLKNGQFYAAGEGFSFSRVNTPLCLTHHPKAPLSPEEVVIRAQRE